MGDGRHFAGMDEMQDGTVRGDVHIQVETSSREGVVASEAVVSIHLGMGLEDQKAAGCAGNLEHLHVCEVAAVLDGLVRHHRFC